MANRFLTTAEVAEHCRVGARTVTNWITTGQLPAAKLGRSWRVTDADLEAFIAKRFATSADEARRNGHGGGVDSPDRARGEQ